MLVLDRPRHDQIINEVREAGARIKLISDGDVGGAIEVAKPSAPVDVLFGIGGTPEGGYSLRHLTILHTFLLDVSSWVCISRMLCSSILLCSSKQLDSFCVADKQHQARPATKVFSKHACLLASYKQ